MTSGGTNTTGGDLRPVSIVAARRESCDSSILSSNFILWSCPLMPLSLPFMSACFSPTGGASDVGAVCDFLAFLAGAFFPLRLPGRDFSARETEEPATRPARGLSSSSSSSSSLRGDNDIRRFLFARGGSLKIEEAGDRGGLIYRAS